MYIIVTAFKSHEPETIEEIGTICGLRHRPSSGSQSTNLFGI